MRKFILAMLLVLVPGVSLAAPAVMYVDAGATGGTYDGLAWATAFREAEFEAALEGGEAGDVYYVMAGTTYTLDSAYDSSSVVGTAVLPISIIGVKDGTANEPPVYTDWPAVGSADRPTFVAADNAVLFGDYYHIYNVIFKTTAADGVGIRTDNVIYNCKVEQSSTTANRKAFFAIGHYSLFLSCEMCGLVGAGVVGRGVHSEGSYLKLLFCYMHDCNTGAYFGSSIHSIIGCVFDTCAVAAVYAGTRDSILFMNNTVYNSPIGVNATTAKCFRGINNIIDTDVTDGFLWTTQTDSNFFWQNHIGNSVTDMWDLVDETNPAYMDNEVTGPSDPAFVNPAAGNFTLGAASPCLDAAKGLELGDE